ncbi:DUF397 domain-containing protein [Amycolatopsis sp. NPDC051371]|uniref:DUF397 domain-containing protein n=1 Tax=Amycolatopsis sp. NPDC051371 TaxID=3155800 RepID=UPI00342F7A12
MIGGSPSLAWRGNSYSGGEVAFTAPAVRVRDSEDPSGPHLTAGASSWFGLLTSVTRTG